MIIKLMRNDGSYWMCDGVDSVDVTPIKDGESARTEAQKDSSISKVVASVFEERHHGHPGQGEGMCITFFDKLGDRCCVLFNTIAYVCNDQGKTVETIFG